MKVTFKCKASGNTVSFTNEDDIKHMREDAQYEEVKEIVAQQVVIEEPKVEVKARKKKIEVPKEVELVI